MGIGRESLFQIVGFAVYLVEKENVFLGDIIFTWGKTKNTFFTPTDAQTIPWLQTLSVQRRTNIWIPVQVTHCENVGLEALKGLNGGHCPSLWTEKEMAVDALPLSCLFFTHVWELFWAGTLLSKSNRKTILSSIKLKKWFFCSTREKTPEVPWF